MMSNHMVEDVLRMRDLVLFGVEVMESEFCVDRVQIRFPRTKKRRIRRKWAKRERNFEARPAKAVYRIKNALGGDYILGHPVTIGKMRDAIQRENEKHVEKWG